MTDIETVACPGCGRLVDNVQAHEGYSCANWPSEEQCATAFNSTVPRDYLTAYVEYRDYHISRSFHRGYEWVHKDYDGPEDNRTGHSHSILGCCMDIDEQADF